ncbi:MAG: thermonuclease family protein [Burkholderiales bacterium]|nr:thermonuclease family protein [Burkholderiales bacterium]
MSLLVLRIAVPAALALAACPSRAAPPPRAPIAGVVTKVIDGDTLDVQVAGQAPMRVRLRDIDAPESCQPWGVEARQALEEMALGKNVELRTYATDRYGRAVASVTVDGRDLGQAMVVEGHAWSVRTRWDNGPLVKQERQARALGRGLHATAGAVSPKEFRQTHGACAPP